MGKVKVKVPNEGFSGTRPTVDGDVVFNNGVAECTDKQAKELTEREGYEIVQEESEDNDSDNDEGGSDEDSGGDEDNEDEIPTMNDKKKKIQDYCDKHGIEYDEDEKRGTLIKKIKEEQNA